MSDDIKSKISELEKELYSKDFKEHKLEDPLPYKEIPVAPSWDTEADKAAILQEEAYILKRHHVMKKFAQFSLGIFVLAIIVAGFIWYRGSNIVSGEKMFIDIMAPVAASGGEPFETKFTITNSNKVAVEAATLFVEYPVGFYSVPDSAELPRTSKDLGMINPGQSIVETINTLLYGEENTSKNVLVTLEYRMAGSNATLKKTTSYPIKVSSSPVNIKLSLPNEVRSGQEVEFTVDISSNTKDSIDALIVDAVYPSGFTFMSASPVPTYGASVWRISDLAPQEKRTIKIRGVVDGQENEEKVIKISVGTQNSIDERIIGIVYNSALESSVITKPFLSLDIAVNNNKAQETVVALNKGVRVDVAWQSNNPMKVSDVVFEVKLKGAALDKYSIYTSGGGFYRSIDNTIIWNKTVSPELALVEPGARGSVSFSFSPVALSGDASRTIKNPQIIFDVVAHGGRVGESGYSSDLTTFATRNINFETDLNLVAKGLYFTGPFKNTGPMPPQADKETTYTISLTARNSSNSISKASVRTTLPLYVTWVGKVSPEGEDLTYNESTSEVTWNVGRIPAGGTRDASFQISFIPSLSQVHQAPKLTGDVFLVGTDDFTKTEISDQKSPITTQLFSDPGFGQSQSNVVN